MEHIKICITGIPISFVLAESIYLRQDIKEESYMICKLKTFFFFKWYDEGLELKSQCGHLSWVND